MRLVIFTCAALLLCSEVFSRDGLDAFLAPSYLNGLWLSPDGTKLVEIRAIEGRQTVFLSDIINDQRETLLDSQTFSENQSYISEASWIDDRYVAMQMTERRKGIEELWSTKIKRRLLIVDTQLLADNPNRLLSVRTRGTLFSPLPAEPFVFLFAKNANNSKIYRIDVRKLHSASKKLSKLDRVDGGQFVPSNTIVSIKGYVLRWFVDVDNALHSALLINKKGDVELRRKLTDGDFQSLNIWHSEKNKKDKKKAKRSNGSSGDQLRKLIPIAIGPKEGQFYCLDAKSELEDKVFLVDYTNDTADVIYEASGYQILDVRVGEHGDLHAVQIEKNGAIAIEYIDTEQSAENQLRVIDRVIDASLQGDVLLSYRESHNEPGAIYIQQGAEAKRRFLLSRYENLADTLISKQVEGKTQSAELSVPWIFNSPQGAQGKTPLIVMPHGGPVGVHDSPYFDMHTQLLVSKGYAVLRVNYRGSSGYGEAYEKAGEKQWGRLMLQDIHFATLDVAARFGLDKRQICVLGFSYGGYASLMLQSKYPDFYRCSVAVSAVTDMALHVSSDSLRLAQREWLQEQVGSIETEYELLKSMSPLYNLAEIKRPILLIHGEQDSVVDVEHFHRMVAMLQKHGTRFNKLLIPEVGHNFETSSSKVMMFESILDFLAKNLSE